jgi:hypothetical protein
LAERAAELGYSHASLEDVCGLAQGHVGKVFGPSRSKGLGFDTFYLLLPALGLKFILATDRDALHRYAERGLKRNGNQARVGNLAQQQVSKRIISRVQRYFGLRSAAARKRKIAQDAIEVNGRRAGAANGKANTAERAAVAR